MYLMSVGKSLAFLFYLLTHLLTLCFLKRLKECSAKDLITCCGDTVCYTLTARFSHHALVWMSIAKILLTYNSESHFHILMLVIVIWCLRFFYRRIWRIFFKTLLFKIVLLEDTYLRVWIRWWAKCRKHW